ncbi:MAG: DegT/DnrJ/EryC1/StrS family aminotransferase [Candidatus Rokubacteria bacterium]|nr:DegT/DnrJ/EryC1/StrS family aminotransferase [Candidatus Rokubacteria bacterium]
MPRSELALLGGPTTRTAPLPPYPVIGAEERRAVMEVLDEGRLSTFIASPGELFLGGKRIRAFERAFADAHGVRFAVAFNSATSALHAAVVALDVPPGHEVLVPPYTFTSTATCALMAGAVPVFVDVEPETFCLDPKALEAALSPLSRAVIPVHLFGHPAPMDEIMDVARRHSLRVIEDAAQAPGAVYRGRPVGTLGDCAVYSFQESKNLMTGEGGMLITDDPQVAEVAQLVRNHGEMIEEASTRRTYRSEILGYGYRMTEFEAALGLVQLGRLPAQNAARQRLAGHLTRALAGVPGLQPPVVRPGCEHVFYAYALTYDEAAWGVPRDRFVAALQAEGIPAGPGYVKPLYLNPLYAERRSWAFSAYRGGARYERGICPVAEDLHFQKVVVLAVVRPPASERDMDDVAAAVHKLWAHRAELARC